MKLIAQIEVTHQVSEDSWRVVRKTMELKPETTVQEISDWVNRITSSRT